MGEIKEVVVEEVKDLAPEGSEMVTNPKKVLSVAREKLDLGQLMEMSEMLSKSTIVPVTYQRRPENCFIALDLASRMGISPMVVMQNLYVVQGKPSWAGQAVSAMIRTSHKFENVQLVYVGKEGSDDWGAHVTAINAFNGAKIKGATVTIRTAKKEGWYQKNGSKWQTMPELMLAYRAFAWFGRVHAPEIMMGLHSIEEVEDTGQGYRTTEAKDPFENGGV